MESAGRVELEADNCFSEFAVKFKVFEDSEGCTGHERFKASKGFKAFKEYQQSSCKCRDCSFKEFAVKFKGCEDFEGCTGHKEFKAFKDFMASKGFGACRRR